ncbi:MAG TPA: copper transporter [Acidimicrobiales bacterium]|nr:copper transporter [Acidimicrobiales bacterium]
MINLRYHIVSLTAVFLAIGIGLTLGSTFLDRATVENLNGQLENLETRLGERDERIGVLEDELTEAEALQNALDEQGSGLLAGRLDEVPVVVVASSGVDQADVDGAVESLQTAGADVQGEWWMTERLLLADQADIDDLAAVLEETSTDPARLRRLAIEGLGREVQASQRLDAGVDTAAEAPLGDDEGVDPSTGDVEVEATDPTDPDGSDDADVEEPGDAEDTVAAEGSLAQGLVDAGFIVFEAVAGGPEALTLPDGVRVVVVGGSPAVPDDVFVQPFVDRLTQGVDRPTRTVVTSALDDGAAVSEAVAAIRADDDLRAVVSTVDRLDHFQGWMATVLAVEDLTDGTIGHYGLGEGAAALLPPLQDP